MYKNSQLECHQKLAIFESSGLSRNWLLGSSNKWFQQKVKNTTQTREGYDQFIDNQNIHNYFHMFIITPAKN